MPGAAPHRPCRGQQGRLSAELPRTRPQAAQEGDGDDIDDDDDDDDPNDDDNDDNYPTDDDCVEDVRKMLDNAGKVLRFSARLESVLPADQHRQFILTYYLEDDSIAIFEQPKANSGIRYLGS